MEGYFVRTLGMHRVYNSAFMHMMMKEENEKYKMLIKNTLEFNPEILKRYVNFMSNPDEETAVNQFGKGDKYFGVAVMLVTMPGLPLFGHGQIEGFSEKYGMEYKRSYYDEFVDGNLVARHEHEIFPLMQKRYLFSQVENFELYDFIDNYGNVNENVFAYSNRMGDDIALIIYNNSYTECKGTIKYSAPRISGNGHFNNKKLAEALGLKWDDRVFYGYRDHKTKFEYLISGRDIHDSGFYLALNGYEYRACLNFREIYDSDDSYRKLYYHLSGRGVYSLEQELREMNLIPLHQSITEFFTPQTFEELHSYLFEEKSFEEKEEVFSKKTSEEAANKLNNIFNHLDYVTGVPAEREKISTGLKKDLEAGRKFNQTWEKQTSKRSLPDWLKEANETLVIRNGETTKDTRNLFITILLLNRIMNTNGKDPSGNLFEKLILGKPLYEILKRVGHPEEKIGQEIHLMKILTAKDKFHIWDIPNNEKPAKEKKKELAAKKSDEKTLEGMIVNDLLKGDDIKYYLLFNEYEGITYYNKERLDNILEWLFTLSCISKTKLSEEQTRLSSGTKLLKEIEELYLSFSRIKEASNKSGYNIEKFKASFSKATKTVPRVTVKPVKTLSKQKTKPKKRK
jgi:hypothetical protein